MEIKLNIYKTKKEIEKTYIAQDFDIMFGVLEDLLNALDLEALVGEDRESMISAVSRLIAARKDVIYPLLKDTFEGLTDDEIRRTKLTELAAAIIALAKYAITQVRDSTFRR